MLSQGGEAIVIGRLGSVLAGETAIRNAVLVLIAAIAVIRLVFAASLGLGVDETYTVATSRQLQMGYFDHPPLAWWLTAAARWITGSEHPVIVRLPFILAFCLTTWFMYALTRLLYGLQAGFWAAVLINIPPVIGWTSGTWVLPDGPLYAALTIGAYALARVLFISRQSPLWWLLAGVAGGFAILSKLHGVFLFAGTLVFLATSARYRPWLASPWPYVGALLALCMLSPTIAWNVQHDWISITFQAQRGEATQFSIGALLALLAGQMVFLLPLMWIALVFAWVRALRRGPSHARDWLLVCLSGGPIVFFTITALWAHRVLPHWAAPGYLLVIPLLGREIARALALSRRWVKPWLWTTASTTAVLVPAIIAIAQFPWPTISLFGQPPIPDPLVETVSWDGVRVALQQRGLAAAPNLVAIGTSWHEAAKLDVALEGRLPVLCLAPDPRGYGLNVRAPSYVGRDVVIVTQAMTPEQVEMTFKPYVDALKREQDVVITRVGKPIFTLHVYTARNLHQPNAGTAINLLDPLGAWSSPSAK